MVDKMSVIITNQQAQIQRLQAQIEAKDLGNRRRVPRNTGELFVQSSQIKRAVARPVRARQSRTAPQPPPLPIDPQLQ